MLLPWKSVQASSRYKQHMVTFFGGWHPLWAMQDVCTRGCLTASALQQLPVLESCLCCSASLQLMSMLAGQQQGADEAVGILQCRTGIEVGLQRYLRHALLIGVAVQCKWLWLAVGCGRNQDVVACL